MRDVVRDVVRDAVRDVRADCFIGVMLCVQIVS